MNANLNKTIIAIGLLALTAIACKTSKSNRSADKTGAVSTKDYLNESEADRNERMAWWRDARFGMFIHWGLYAVPAGEWGGKTEYGEWIRHTAQIPLGTYDKFAPQFNPVKFNAEDWVKMAKYAGMKYIVITSKHHDGFSIYDSKVSDFDIMATPFKRDVLQELAAACKREGIKLCFYHSIMDWHHPDYLPRRPWEEKDRPADGADYERYLTYMKAQLKELCTNYGEAPYVMWFDGEWESTWNTSRGTDLYNYVRSLKPSILINNRVGADRDGMAGMTKKGKFGGDFGTPEQEIPATGLPGVDWESCMTMNGNWGYNKADKNFKSTEELIHNLVDIASKGGNFLLNVGPTSEGLFPAESMERLQQMGDWIKANGESIYGTSPSPLGLFDWGRLTLKEAGNNTKLYLHVWDLPKNGKLVLHGVANEAMGAQFLAHPYGQGLKVSREEDALVIDLPKQLPDPINSVVVLQLKGKADFHITPSLKVKHEVFIDQLELGIVDESGHADIHYSLDGSEPTAKSPLYEKPLKLTKTTTVAARSFRNGKAISGTVRRTLSKVDAQPASGIASFAPGLQYFYYEGLWSKMPDFNKEKLVKKGTSMGFDRSARNHEGERFGFEFRGFVQVPADGIYTFTTASDDGSMLYVNNKLVVDNDNTHGLVEQSGVVALKAGYHELIVRYFEATGGDDLKVYWESESFDRKELPASALFHVPTK